MVLQLCMQVLRRHYSHQADIWSCGVILYILLSGVPPFWGESEQQIFDSILKGNLDFQSDPWPQISAEAKDCVKQMLQQVCHACSNNPEMCAHQRCLYPLSASGSATVTELA